VEEIRMQALDQVEVATMAKFIQGFNTTAELMNYDIPKSIRYGDFVIISEDKFHCDKTTVYYYTGADESPIKRWSFGTIIDVNEEEEGVGVINDYRGIYSESYGEGIISS
jgi:hypothetical protein